MKNYTDNESMAEEKAIFIENFTIFGENGVSLGGRRMKSVRLASGVPKV
jgi:hypothetical protein